MFKSNVHCTYHTTWSNEKRQKINAFQMKDETSGITTVIMSNGKLSIRMEEKKKMVGQL